MLIKNNNLTAFVINACQVDKVVEKLLRKKVEKKVAKYF